MGERWHVDETYLKVAGNWRYLYRAIDQFGQVVDVLVSSKRDADAARRFRSCPLPPKPWMLVLCRCHHLRRIRDDGA